MPITVITGTPGAGKTLLALELFFAELGIDATSEDTLRASLRNAKRPHAIIGVEGLKPGLFNELESAMEWDDLDDGTLVLVDEAWKWWGKHLTHIRTDERYLRLAEHRHRGFDFIVTTQAPAQLQDHVRSLAGTHHHVMRKFGTSHTMRYEWAMLQESPNSPSIRKSAIEKHWSQPWKKIGWVYQSATQHTIKRKIPLKIIAIPALLLAVVALGFTGFKSMASIGDDVVPGARAAAGEHASGSNGLSQGDKVMSTEDWLLRFSPRVAHMPSSAPAYDDRPVVAEPTIACMIGESVGCICKTEQGTDWELPAATCKRVVLGGGIYDPFKRPGEATRPADRPKADDSGGGAISHNGGLRPPVGSSSQPVTHYGQFRGQAAGAAQAPP